MGEEEEVEECEARGRRKRWRSGSSVKEIRESEGRRG